MKGVNAIMAAEIYGKLIEVGELDLPTEVTVTRDDGEQTWNSLKALVGLHAFRDHNDAQPKKRGRKAAGAGEASDSVATASEISYQVRREASVTFKVQSGTSEPEELLAEGACAVFLAYVCEVGSVLEIAVSEEGGNQTITEIAVLSGSKTGETSRSLEPPTKDTTKPAESPVDEDEPTGGDDEEGEDPGVDEDEPQA